MARTKNPSFQVDETPQIEEENEEEVNSGDEESSPESIEEEEVNSGDEESSAESIEEEEEEVSDEEEKEEQVSDKEGEEEEVERSGSAEEEGSDEEGEALKPLKMYFSPKYYTQQIKIQSRCYIKEAVEGINTVLNGNEKLWFYQHPQFKHFFHMHVEKKHKVMGMWMLLLHTAITEKNREAWFIVNGVPI